MKLRTNEKKTIIKYRQFSRQNDPTSVSPQKKRKKETLQPHLASGDVGSSPEEATFPKRCTRVKLLILLSIGVLTSPRSQLIRRMAI